MSRIAVVLFNLGGPDRLESVRPFLYNLFKDPAIIGAPALVRYPLAAFISRTREKSAQANYALMGGASPLLPETQKQAQALQILLKAERPDDEVKVFIAMRYWKPFASETAKAVTEFRPDELVLLPLYPQFSTTTTASSLKDWLKVYRGTGQSRAVCCFPTSQGVIKGHAKAIRQTWEAAGRPGGVRLLFSAHGLPEKIVEDGDPYQAQIQASSAAIAALLPELPDWNVCYQSRVGPLKWLGPSTDFEIRRAGAEGKGVLLCPVAFVSDHIEPALGVDGDFIAALASAVNGSLARPGGTCPDGEWTCPSVHLKCPRSVINRQDGAAI